MLSATMNIIGGTSMMNMRFGSQGSGSNLREQPTSAFPPLNPTVQVSNNTAKSASQNLQNTTVLEEDEKAIT